MKEQAPGEADPNQQPAEEKPQPPLLNDDPSSAKASAEQAANVESASLDYGNILDQSQRNVVESIKPSQMVKDGKQSLNSLNIFNRHSRPRHGANRGGR